MLVFWPASQRLLLLQMSMFSSFWSPWRHHCGPLIITLVRLLRKGEGETRGRDLHVTWQNTWYIYNTRWRWYKILCRYIKDESSTITPSKPLKARPSIIDGHLCCCTRTPSWSLDPSLPQTSSLHPWDRSQEYEFRFNCWCNCDSANWRTNGVCQLIYAHDQRTFLMDSSLPGCKTFRVSGYKSLRLLY